MVKKRKIFCGRCTEPLTLKEGERYGTLHTRSLGLKGQQTQHLCDECLVDSGISHRLVGAKYPRVD
jgi:hypothetical protein